MQRSGSDYLAIVPMSGLIGVHDLMEEWQYGSKRCDNANGVYDSFGWTGIMGHRERL